jgi:hypothetical protein
MQLKIAIQMAAFPWITWQTILPTQGRKERICLKRMGLEINVTNLAIMLTIKTGKHFQNYGILK